MTAGVSGQETASSATEEMRSRDELVIRRAYVMTMNPALGDMPNADIHIRQGEIAAVGQDLKADGASCIDATAMIALPGFVDTHWHLWNSTLRGLISYVNADNSYFPLTMRLGPLSTPEDSFCNVRMGVAEALLSGITTVHDWAHNVVTPAHADAEIRALRQMGIRARFSYGWGQNLPVETAMNAADVARVKRQWFSDSGRGLCSLGVAVRTPVAYQRGNVPIEVLKRDWSAARDLGLPITIHNRPGVVSLLEQSGLLGPDVLLVHPQAFTSDEIQVLARRRVKISSSPVNENARGINGPRGPIQFSELLAAGVQWSLSVDEVATNGKADFFSVMRELIRSDWQRAGDHTRVAPRRILELATVDGARALGIEEQIGSLSPGKRADIILIRTTDVNMTPTVGDPSSMLVFSAQPNNVDTVIVDGRILVANSKPVGFEIGAIVREADKSAKDLFARDPLRQ
jgi:5-methylthioadenosine/S-adenosylhomocysteine deaminase